MLDVSLKLFINTSIYVYIYIYIWANLYMYRQSSDVATSLLIQPFHEESYHICLQSLLAQRLFCGSWPKLGEDRSSVVAFCRREKTEFLRTFNEADAKIAMELRWFQHDMDILKSSFDSRRNVSRAPSSNVIFSRFWRFVPDIYMYVIWGVPWFSTIASNFFVVTASACAASALALGWNVFRSNTLS